MDCSRFGISRGAFLGGTAAFALAAASTPAFAAGPVGLKVRWYGGGVYELASPDDKQIVLVDAWIWNNKFGYTAFGITQPPELSSAAAYAAALKARNPDVVIVALTHDHGDHIGDYFELLKALVDAGIDVKTSGQSDMMRVALVPKFKEAGLDNTKVVLNGGAGQNMGGISAYKGVTLHLTPASHSTFSGFPAAGFIIDLAGVRIYASGDTDVFGDMSLIGSRYKPDIAFLSAGGGPYTMDAKGAAEACKMLAVPHAVPVHYAHNPAVAGIQGGNDFKREVALISPKTAVTVLTLAQASRISITPRGAA
jgi:L-ascorbate metabolism protein UlaG (beta-lactamase superfamily)